jgi:Fic family protein
MALQNSEVETRSASGNESVAPFTLEDVNKALAASHEEERRELAEDGFLTTQEWAAMWDKTERTAQRKLGQLRAIGLLETREVVRIGLAGQRCVTPVYKILIEKEK